LLKENVMSEWIKKLAEAYTEVNENKNAAVKKALAKASAPSEKGKKAVTLPKAPFAIPEDVPMDERDMFMAKAAAAHKAGKSHFMMPGGKKHPVTMKKDTAQAVNSSTNEAADLNKANADAAIKHDCATHVEHAEWGKGQPISEQHTIVETAPGEGYVTHYDVMFEHGIEKEVAVEDLTILAEMSHGHSKKKSKNEMSSKEKMKRGLYNGSKDDEEVVMNPKKDKKEKSTENDSMAQESVIPPVYARIIEARATADADGKHKGKGADPESWDEKEKNNKGAMDMKADHKGETIDNPEAGDQMTKAANAAPNAPARKGDNAAGDKKIIPSATPTKGM